MKKGNERTGEVVTFGSISLIRTGNRLQTCTQEVYAVNTGGFDPVLAYNRSFLMLPWDTRYEEGNELLARRVTDRLHGVCVLAGDESRVYWKYRMLEDDSVVVMDREGTYYHVTPEAGTHRAVKVWLGKAVTPSEEDYIDMRVRELENRISRERQQRELALEAKRKKERKGMLKGLRSAVPFQMGSKWGLRTADRMVVPPVYRRVSEPVGDYCAFEMYPDRWGVMELDGKVVIEPKYQRVCFCGKKRVKLTLVNNRTEEVRL